MEDIWLTCVKRLQSIASTGIHFTRDKYDKERYEEIATIANEMLFDFGVEVYWKSTGVLDLGKPEGKEGVVAKSG